MKLNKYVICLMVLHAALGGMQDPSWRVNQSGALSTLSIRPFADSAYAIPIAPVQTLWSLSNVPRPSFISSLAAQMAEPVISIEPPKSNTEPIVTYIASMNMPMGLSPMQKFFESTLVYQPLSFHQAQDRFLSKYLHHIAHYPGGLDVYRVRTQVIKYELSQVIAGMRQATSSIVNKSCAECAAAFESWIKLNDMIISVPELNLKFKEKVAELQKITVDNTSLACNPVISEEVACKAQKIIDKFEKSITSWVENHNQLQQQCAQDTEKFFDKQYPQGPPPLASNFTAQHNVSQARKVSEWNFLKETADLNMPEFTKKLKSADAFQDLSYLIRLCNEGKFGEAHQIVSKYCGDGNSIISIPFRAIYCSRFAQVCTPEGIEKSLVSNDPHYQEIKAQFLPSSNSLPQIHKKNGEIALRKQHYESLKQFLSISKTNDTIDQIIYKMIDQKISQWDACGDFLNSLNLVSDSPDPLKREACAQLYENGLPRGVCKAQQNLICVMPSKIDTSAHISERTLLWNLVKCSALHPSKFMHIKLAANYLQKGLNEGNASYLRFAYAMGYALKNPSGDQRVLQLADYSKDLNNLKQTKIQEAAVRFIANDLDGSKWNEINNVDKAYRAMLLGDAQGEFYLEQALLHNGLNSHVLSTTYDAPMPHFDGVKEGAVVAHVQEDKNTTKVLLQNGTELSLKTYEMLPSVTQFLLKNGLDPQKYALLRGTLAQHVNHADILKQVAKQHDLSGLQLVESSNLHQLLQLSTQVSDLSREYNSVGNIMQSSVLSHFCWQMVGYVENAAKFGFDTTCSFGQGLYKGLRNFSHTATHPQELLYDFKNLVLGMAKVMYANAVLEEKFSMLNTPEQNEQIIREYAKQFEPIFQEIQERASHVTFQDVVREGTALTVENLITTRAFATFGKIAKATKLHGNELVQRIAQTVKNPEVIATTVEGIEIRAVATQVGENSVLKEAAQAVRNGGQEVILSKVQTYEQARNEALKIIGKIDPNSGIPHVGRFGVCENKIVGRRWLDNKVTMRLDYDPIKGPHINVTDYRLGRGPLGKEVCIPFEGNEQTINALLKHMNNETSLEQARIIFQQSGNEKDLAKIMKTINQQFN